MRQPRYSIGDRILHPSKKTYATVEHVINRADSEDVRAQGFRYEVRHSGWVWSVSESDLKASKY